ncbi:hypothetical protein IRT45_02080 [Nocardia sp. BSTN01]|uniref:DUF8020 domain-containing protein n=1 Tax=Nocardia kruczakiae TaxID=261477 RepID=A0ABU1X884_9NOCA|nr:MULTISPECIES: hypothetical protein [Nocardia]MBF4995938.1 hypothetical protein [Nocardia sp. BSTN01]MDR7166758.1 hypothetical protein [Nocardia kruczakiae]
MRAKKFAATALLAVGATTAAAGVVQAAPATASEIAVRGVEQGVGFVTAPTADHTGLTTTVDAGSFTVTGDSVTLTDAAGRAVASVPLGLRTASGTVGLTPRIENAGRTLTLTPQSATERTAQAIDEASDTLARKQYNAGVGAAVGAGIGAVLGFFLGGVGALITIPIGAGIGALIGYSTP